MEKINYYINKLLLNKHLKKSHFSLYNKKFIFTLFFFIDDQFDSYGLTQFADLNLQLLLCLI